MTDYLRARYRAGRQRLRHEVHVQSGLLGHRHAFGEARYLHRAHQIVDQLEDGAGADGAKMPDHVADRREIGFCSIEIGGVSADEQGQFPARRRLRRKEL